MHSPLPWTAEEEYPEDAGERGYKPAWLIRPATQDDGMAYGWRWLSEADAKFICRAVNSHHALLSALKDLMGTDNCLCAHAVGIREDHDDECTRARAAIAHAEATPHV